MRLGRYIVLIFVFCLLLGCSQKPPTATETPMPEITIDNDYVIVMPSTKDDTTAKAAVYLQTALDNKLRLQALNIVSKDPGEQAIVLSVDSAMEANAFEFRTSGTSLYISAGDSQALLYAVKQLRQAMMDNNRSTRITPQMCTSLSGKADLLPFTVISQNILFKNIEGGNTIKDRAPRFISLVKEYQPDILAIQESCKEWQNYYDKFLSDTYFAINQESRTVLLRTERYDLIEHGYFWLSPTPNVQSQFEGDSGPRSCCWAIIHDKTTGMDLFICNAHLDWNNDTQRALQLEVLIEQMRPYYENYPSIICGDFNSGPGGPIHDRACQLFLDSRVSAAKNISTTEFTSHGFGASAKTIDYIFHTEELQADLYYVVSDDYGGYVSDHYGVLTDFHFAK